METDVKKTEVLEAIRNRRSTRTFLDNPVPEEIIKEIVEAGRYAPSASNTQATHFYVITNKEKLAELKKLVSAVIASMQEKEGMSPTFLKLIARAKEGEIDVTYGAPVLIVTTHRKASQNAVADCSCALQNMMLAASVCKVACVWINQFFTLRDEPPIKEFFASLGVTDEDVICGALSLGYSENIASGPLPRTGFPVKYID